MVAIVRRDRFFRLPKTQRLITPNIHLRHGMVQISFEGSGRGEYVLVEIRDCRCSSFGHVEINGGKSLRHIAKGRAALVTAKPVAPRTSDGNVILVARP